MVFAVAPAARAAGLSAALWDFNGDGVFDALGPTVTTAFPVPGRKIVQLVTVDRGGNSGAAATVADRRAAVASRAGPAPPPPAPAPPPTARADEPVPDRAAPGPRPAHGIRVTRLARACARRARACAAVCLGRHRGCPRRSVVRRSRSPRTAVRLRRFERRLRPGAVIQIFVTAPQAIGKYVRFRVAQGRAPARRDMCVAPAGLAPPHCPGE